jgi:hypothetical protein
MCNSAQERVRLYAAMMEVVRVCYWLIYGPTDRSIGLGCVWSTGLPQTAGE